MAGNQRLFIHAPEFTGTRCRGRRSLLPLLNQPTGSHLTLTLTTIASISSVVEQQRSLLPPPSPSASASARATAEDGRLPPGPPVNFVSAADEGRLRADDGWLSADDGRRLDAAAGTQRRWPREVLNRIILSPVDVQQDQLEEQRWRSNHQL